MKIIVNGIFDLFHDGHKYLLDQAFFYAGEGGEVFILINSNLSTRDLKGPGRPLDPLYERAWNITSYIEQIEEKFFFRIFNLREFHSERQLKGFINQFEPDIIIKGNDRPDVRTITGSDLWPVLILPRIKDLNGEDISTTNIIKEKKLKDGKA